MNKSYSDQLLCVFSKLRAIVESADKDTVFVFHGDHGSRLVNVVPSTENIGKFAAEDLAAGFSTLFALRAPNAENRYDDKAMPVRELLRLFALNGFSGLPENYVPPDAGSVNLVSMTEPENPGSVRESVRYPTPSTWLELREP